MANHNLTAKQARDTLALLSKHNGNISAAARSLKESRTTVQSRVNAAQALLARGEKPEEASRDTTPLAERQRLDYEDRLKTLEKRLREAQQADLTAEKISAYYFDLKGVKLAEPRWLVDVKPGAGTCGVPVVNWSDWHAGEVVDPKQVEGANSFNEEIFERRVRTLVDRTLDLCMNHMTGTDYPGIVVNLGGDMISGDIHDEIKETNERPTIPTVLDTAALIAWALRALADKFGSVFVVGTPGNHGRNTFKPRFKNVCYTSFDWMLYKILESWFADDDRFTFMIPDGFDAYYKVYGHRILLTHGDRLGVKGGDGFIGALGPIMRGAKKLRLAYAARGREIDTILMGHWHNEFAIPGLRVNNCLKGYDEFAQGLRFEPRPPSQDLFFIHHKRGITCSWPIQLEGPQHSADKTTWISLPAKD